MSTEQLPRDLENALSFCAHANLSGFAGVDETKKAHNAIRAEHAQRLTLQHHAADQVWLIADLEVKCVTLKELHDAAADERDELRAKYDELLVALHGIGKALGIPEGDRSPYSVTCGVLERVNRLAEIEAQEPVATAWITGGRMVNAFNHPPRSDFDPDGRWAEIGYSQQPLYARPVPAQAVPDGCGACGDGCAKRGSCRLADESPEAAR